MNPEREPRSIEPLLEALPADTANKSPMQSMAQVEAEAYAFRQLVAHLQARTDVQNIELMILSGFCRNCLSKWYHVGAAHAGVGLSYEDACERVYGMAYNEWKTTHQSKASDEQLLRLEETKARHAKHEKPPPVAVAPPAAASAASPALAAPPPPTMTVSGGNSNVCCVPEDELAAACARPALPAPALPPPPPAAPVAIRLGILTVSDRASEGVYANLSGPEIANAMQAFAGSPAGAGWRLTVVHAVCVPDDVDAIRYELRTWSERPSDAAPTGAGAAAPAGCAPCNLILTTGGTGLAARDVTPEATRALLERPTPGITELLLRESLRVEPLAALSRAAAGLRGETLIVNLPGRPKAVRENLAVLMPLLGHCLLSL